MMVRYPNAITHPTIYYKLGYNHQPTQQKTGEQYLPGSVIFHRIFSNVGTRLYGVPIHFLIFIKTILSQ